MRILLPALAVLSLAACNQNTAEQPLAEQPVSRPAPTITASTFPEGLAIDAAQFTAPFGQTPAVDPSAQAQQKRVFIKAQVLLDRAHFGPGVIDGEEGENFKLALAAYEKARGMTSDGKLDAQVWQALTADARPVMQDYTISEDDVDGPFVESIPGDYKKLAQMDGLSFTSPLELLAEKFHMDQELLKALNPGVDFGKAGTKILVAAPVRSPLPQVRRVEVDKANQALRAYDGSNKLVAIYPATVGSSNMPSPTGTWKVTAVAHDPVWNYDPAKLNFGDKSLGKLTIPAGPNNPVGLVWIDLSKDTYGIHGTAEPSTIGKTSSHGCVRLTNWDAQELAEAVEKGVEVVFVSPSSAT